MKFGNILCLLVLRVVNAQQHMLVKDVNGVNTFGKLYDKMKKCVRIGTKEFCTFGNLTNSEIVNLSKTYKVDADIRTLMVDDKYSGTNLSKTSGEEWHLDRIDQVYLPLDGKKYSLFNRVSSNIDVYIIDTGIDFNHPEFTQNNKINGPNFVDNVNYDCNSHGTHVASLASGKTKGVLRGSTLIAVKVLDCDGYGTWSGLIDAIAWVVNRAKSTKRLSIINMSLGGGFISVVNDAVSAAFDEGVFVVTAAGNSDDDACKYSPGSTKKSITVGATDVYDKKASFSNWGKCVDLYAPGACVNGAIPNGGYAVYCGTSMAAPIATGVLGLYLSKFGRVGFDIFRQIILTGIVTGLPSSTGLFYNKFTFVSNVLMRLK